MSEETVSPENIRSLIYHLGMALDERIMIFRKGTPYQSVRPSDVRAFVTAAQSPKTISEIARQLGITRQAVQASIQRLQKLQVLDLQPMPHNKRDKLVVLTTRGRNANNTAAQQVGRFEKEFALVIGEEGMKQFRKNLVAVLEATRLNNKADAEP